MATATNRKTSCVICQKVAGIFTCRGCGNDFCYRHVAVHRQELSKEMEELTNNHNLLQQTIHEQKVDPNRHPLIEEINVWEQESIEKIHQAASDARRQVITVTNTDHTKLLEDLHSLATVLSTARNEDDYVETDLKEWKEKLEELNTIFSADEMIRFNQDDTENSLISKIFYNHPSHDIFFQTTGDMQISEQGKVITHGPTNRAAAARCKGEYSLKQQRFRFKIESSTDGFCCGIISKDMPVDSIFYPSQNATMQQNIHFQYFGSHMYPNVVLQPELNNKVLVSSGWRQLCFCSLHTYEILVDYNRRTICITDEQMHKQLDLVIDPQICPAPWQFFVALANPGSCVRLCE